MTRLHATPNILGDALGAPIEFMKLPEIRARFRPDGIRDYAPAYGRDAGAITDDTQMTLFTAEGLIRAAVRYAGRGICSPPSVVMHAYMRWLRTQGETSKHPFFAHGETGWLVGERALWSRRAPGNTCLSALRDAADDDLFATNDSKGCGGIMRVAPVGLVANDPFTLGCEIARLTHGHPAGYLSAGVFAEIISLVMKDVPLREAIDRVRQRPIDIATSRAIDAALRLVDEGGEPTPERVESLGEAWVAEESLAIALYCALVAKDFDHGVTLAVNHGGDSDSTGSLVGNLLGAMWGREAIAEKWLERLELREVIETIAKDLARAARGGRELEREEHRYPGW